MAFKTHLNGLYEEEALIKILLWSPLKGADLFFSMISLFSVLLHLTADEARTAPDEAPANS